MQWSRDSRILVQGLTTPRARYYTLKMQEYGTKITAGVDSGYGGDMVEEIPLYDLVEQALTAFPEISTSLIFVPPYQVLDAAREAMAAGLRQLILITNHVPALDMLYLLSQAQATNTLVLGSGSQGLFIPNQLCLGLAQARCYSPGTVGLISRGDRLSDEVALALTQAGLGQSLAISLGSDAVVGTTCEQWLQYFEEDDQTEAIVLIAHPAYTEQLGAIDYITSAIEKPVILYLPGSHVPLERNLGDATTIITHYLSASTPSSGRSLEQQIVPQLTSPNLHLATSLAAIPPLVKSSLSTTKKPPE